MHDSVKTAIKAPFRLIGLDLVRQHIPEPERDLPPLFDHPLEALCYRQGGKREAFHLPLALTVKHNGLSYSPDGWHPFVATLREYRKGEIKTYDHSILKRFYETHRPANARDAIIGFDQAPRAFRAYPGHVNRCTPWRSMNADEVDKNVRRWSREHSEKYGGANENWSLEADGYPYHGPVSLRKGRLEYHRLIDVYESIKANGYDRSQGHSRPLLLKRDAEFRFLGRGQGNHRTAAMTALGFQTIPARFHRQHVVDIEMAEHWPQVRSGLWTQEQAEAYFNHLFDFDSRAWARARGLERTLVRG